MRQFRPLSIAVALVLSAATVAVAAQSGSLRSRIGQRMQSGIAARQHVELPAGVRRLPDLAYGSDPAQRLDVYLPAHASGRIIVMVHGGGWRRGDKAMGNVVDNKLAHWSTRGDILVSVDYRMLPQADVAQQARDVAAALVYVQRHAREWSGDPANLVLMGHSAGAHLVALLSSDPSLAPGARPWRATVSLDSAALDVPTIMQGRHLSLYDDAFGRDPANWRALSPLQQLTAKAPPMLLVCSSQRRDSCPASRAFADAAQRLKVRTQVLPQDLSHGQINTELGLPGAYTDAVDAFLDGLPSR
ncbi:MAG: alpha/beta hydrolase [Proteobacteria bacterium]|nr:alpha/beta hydrolase [Pseudomonadota bacterium]